MARTLLTGATLIDGTGSPPRPRAAVLIEDARIAGVGPASDFEADGAEVIDLGGATLLPGLVNAHEHYSIKGFTGQYYDQYRQDARLQMFRMAQAALGAIPQGITTARDCGAHGTINLLLREAISLGIARGPRVVTCGQVIQPRYEGEGVKPLGMARPADDAADAARLTRELIAEGVDFIKVKVWWPSYTGHGQRNFTVEELRAVFDTAHAAGKRAAAHVREVSEVRDALEAGTDSIEHANHGHTDVTVAEEIARRGTFFVPNWASWSRSWSNFMPGTPEERRANHRVFVEAAIRAGVRIAVGTDLYAVSMVDEMEALTEFGLGPHEAIQAATRVGAELTDLDSEIGTIEGGKRADLIAVEGDPIADLGVLREPSLVIRDGQIQHQVRQAVGAA